MRVLKQGFGGDSILDLGRFDDADYDPFRTSCSNNRRLEKVKGVEHAYVNTFALEKYAETGVGSFHNAFWSQNTTRVDGSNRNATGAVNRVHR